MRREDSPPPPPPVEGGGRGFRESGLALSLRGAGDHLLSGLCCRLLKCHGQVMGRILSGIKQHLHLAAGWLWRVWLSLYLGSQKAVAFLP